jgi:Tfp pilus assembly protein PilX
MRSYPTNTAVRPSNGFTLIASLLMLLLMSGLAIGLMMMVNTEGKVGGGDLQNNLAFHAAEGGIEKMYSDLSAAIQNAEVPTASEICGVGATTNQPTLAGVTWKDYSVRPGTTQGSACPTSLTYKWGQIGSGPNQGLYAQVIPVNMLATAALVGGQEVSMSRSAHIALIPVFQFGMFCDGDCSIFPGGDMTFAGRVHTNGDFYPFVGGSATLTFQSKISAYGNFVRTVLPNGNTASGHNGTVNVPTASNANACSTPTTNCTTLAGVSTSSPWGNGSVQGQGGNPLQSTYVGGTWTSFSSGTTNYQVINGNYGNQASGQTGTGAKKLSLPFVNGTNRPYEILRRPDAGESANSPLGQSREYNMAQIRVLLSDDPAEFQNGSGATDANNVRLANVSQTSATATQWGVTIPSTNIGSTFSLTGYTNLYFAAASNAVPIPSSCSGTTCATDDWPSAPKTWTSAMAATDGIAWVNPPNPNTAPLNWVPSSGSPSLNLCPPAAFTGTIPAGCPTGTAAGLYPYYALPNPGLPVVSGALTQYNVAANTSSWNLIDGWLRVEYLNNTGTWVPVTNEWLQLGFARGVKPPTAPGTNPINPNAILLLQQPADRSTSNTLVAMPAATGAPSTATAPACTSLIGCSTWSAGSPPQLVSDAGSGAQWAFGVTPSSPGATTPQSLTEYNWYPINFYDVREGEPRDNDWSTTIPSDNTCTANGVMNAVEIDVGNLKRWLAGTIGSSGTNVNSSNQNGYVLYFSDRRGMLPNPHLTPPHALNTKTGDAGLEDTVNASSTPGTPDGVKEANMAGQSISPEDDNQNTFLDNFGAYNLGLGFTGTLNSPGTNLNTQINSTGPSAPDPYGTTPASGGNRIQSCSTTGRKNWVSGARHVLKLVDGSLGNVPLSPTTTVYAGVSYHGGFTVASENPVYIQGDYNSNASDTVWNTTPTDATGMAAAAVIADSVTLLSNNWDDRASMLGSPTHRANRLATTTYYRLAVAAGKNRTFASPSWNGGRDDVGTDGGIHNFLHLAEDWGGQITYYKGSLASLYYSTYNTGFYKCCTTVYNNGTRRFSFDMDFSVPAGLPPGTPLFRDVESLGYRQLFTARSN